MADEPIIDPIKAAKAQGAGADDLDPATTGGGNPAPAEPTNKAPVVEPTPEEKEATATEEAEKVAADKEAADKAAAEAAETPDDKPLDTDVWGSTGDDVGDSVLSMLQNSGITTDEAKSLMFDAIQAGDVTQIDKAALIEKVGKNKAALIMAGAENFISRSTAKAATIVAEVHTTVGGKDNWDAVTTWAKENVSETDMADYSSMIDAGGAKARFAAQELASRYNTDSKNTTLPTADAEIVGDGKATPTTRSTTRAEYVSELEKAYDTAASEAVIKEIKAARARGRAAGM